MGTTPSTPEPASDKTQPQWILRVHPKNTTPEPSWQKWRNLGRSVDDEMLFTAREYFESKEDLREAKARREEFELKRQGLERERRIEEAKKEARHKEAEKMRRKIEEEFQREQAEQRARAQRLEDERKEEEELLKKARKRFERALVSQQQQIDVLAQKAKQIGAPAVWLAVLDTGEIAALLDWVAKDQSLEALKEKFQRLVGMTPETSKDFLKLMTLFHPDKMTTADKARVQFAEDFFKILNTAKERARASGLGGTAASKRRRRQSRAKTSKSTTRR